MSVECVPGSIVGCVTCFPSWKKKGDRGTYAHVRKLQGGGGAAGMGSGTVR